MKIICISICAIFLFVLKDVHCLRNYALTLRSTELEETNKSYVDVHEFYVKKLNRSYSVLNFNATLLVPLKILYIHVQIYQYRSNRYFPSIMNKTFDACHLMKNIDNIPYINIIAELIYKERNFFFKKCPVLPATYYLRNLHIDEERLPPFFLPAGRWKFELSFFFEDKVLILRANGVFDITAIISRKQQIS